MKRSDQVFGMSNIVLQDSYVDRGRIDEEFSKLLERKSHIAIRGPSKCGKSWLRQKMVGDAIVVQCRLGSTVADIYKNALSELGIKLTIEESSKFSVKGKIESEASLGVKLISSVLVKAGLEVSNEEGKKVENVGKDINDLRFVAAIIIESGRRLVVEDVHYLSSEVREHFSFDLKTLWDYGCFVVLVGIWGQYNYFAYLNSDLSGRIEEINIEWGPDDLRDIILNGCKALKLEIARDIQNKIIIECFGSAGLLQRLILKFLDENKISHEQTTLTKLEDVSKFESAAMAIADQLNGVYIKFAERVAGGIRSRADSTGIYAHAMAVIMESSDTKLMNGLSIDDIYAESVKRQPRIQKQNLKSILAKIDSLQIDKDGRGLVVTYVQSEDEVLNVDRQLLFYRKYITIKWPWEDLIAEASAQQSQS